VVIEIPITARPSTATNQFHANARARPLLFKNPEVLFLTLSFQANVLFVP